MPLAVRENICSASFFREYLASGAAGILQEMLLTLEGVIPLSSGRSPGHLAESFNMQVISHFLTGLHISLAAAIPK